MKICALFSICVENQITFYERNLRVGAVAVQIHDLTQIEYCGLPIAKLEKFGEGHLVRSGI